MDPSQAPKSLNLWRFNLNKLNNELQCPLCLDLFKQPALLPCDHIYCDSCIRSAQNDSEFPCPCCLRKYSYNETRPAPYMEKIVSIYKGLDSSFTSIQAGSGDHVRASEQCVATTQKENVQKPQEGTSTIPLTPSQQSNHSVELSEKKPKADSRVLDDRKLDIGSCCGQNLNVESENMDLETDPVEKDSRLKEPSPSNVQKPAGKRSFQKDSNSGGKENLDTRTTTRTGSEPKKAKRQKTMSRHSNGIKLPRDENKTQKAKIGQPSTSNIECAFCHSCDITDNTGPMLHICDGLEVNLDTETFSKIIHVHTKCVEWAPEVYYKADKMTNLEAAVRRANMIKCAFCGKKGAALGCYSRTCPKSFHVLCAFEHDDCKWDIESFLVLCPTHKSSDFPKKKKKSSQINSGQPSNSSSPCEAKGWCFCTSDLSSENKFHLAKFAEKYDAPVYDSFPLNLTHLIVSTNEEGAYKRTPKVLQAILTGKWILSMDWVNDCRKANKPLDELPYEVSLDNHGSRDGPKTGRRRALKNAQKLFVGFNFIFSYGFKSYEQTELMDLVRLGGGNVIEKWVKVESGDCDVSTATIVVYKDNSSEDASAILAKAKDLADKNGCKLIKHTWIFECIAVYKLQHFPIF